METMLRFSYWPEELKQTIEGAEWKICRIVLPASSPIYQKRLRQAPHRDPNASFNIEVTPSGKFDDKLALASDFLKKNRSLIEAIFTIQRRDTVEPDAELDFGIDSTELVAVTNHVLPIDFMRLCCDLNIIVNISFYS